VEQNEETASALERRKDALIKKAKEYQKELDLLKVQCYVLSRQFLPQTTCALQKEIPDEPTVTVTELAAQQERIRKKEQEVKAKKAKIKAFQGLPPVRASSSYFLPAISDFYHAES
jgi:HAUS augmin-like complex subunit 1